MEFSGEEQIEDSSASIHEGIDDVDHLHSIIDALTSENETLKDQLTRAVGITGEIESMHQRNRSLSAQLAEAQQTASNYMERMSLFQTKCGTLASQLREKDAEVENLKTQKDAVFKELNDIQARIVEQNATSLREFLNDLGCIMETEFKSFEDILAFAKKQKTEPPKEDPRIKTLEEQLKCLEVQNKKLKRTAKVDKRPTEEPNQQEEKRQLEMKIAELEAEKETLVKEQKKCKRQLELQKNQAETEIAKLTQKVDASEQRIQSLKTRLQNPIFQSETEINQFIKEIEDLKSNNDELQRIIQAQTADTEELRSKLQEAGQIIKASKTDKEKLKSKLLTLNKLYQKSEAQLKEMASKETGHELVQNELKSQIKELQQQQTLADNEIQSLKDAIKEEEENNQKLLAGYQLMHQSLIAEKDQIEHLANERTLLVKCIRDQQKAITAFEPLLSQKTQRIVPQSLTDSQVLLYLQNNYFDGLDAEMRDRMIIFCSTHRDNPSECIRQILKRETVSIQSPVEDNRFITVAEDAIQMILGQNTLREDVLQFLKTQFEEMAKIVPPRIRSIFDGTPEQQQKTLLDISQQGFSSQQTFSVICFLTLANSALMREIESIRSETNEDLGKILAFYNCSSAQDVISNTKQLLKRVKKLKTDKKRLQEIVDTPVDDHQEEIANLTAQLETTTKALKAAKEDVKDAEMQVNKFVQMNEDSKKENETLRKELLENEQLVDHLRQCNREQTLQLNRQKVEAESQRASLRKDIETLQAEIQQTRNKYEEELFNVKEVKKKNEEKLVARINSLRDNKNSQDTSRKELEAKIAELTDSLREKSSENRDLSLRLAKLLSNTERSSHTNQSELSKLAIDNKTLELQVKTLQDQLKRETMLIKSECSFQSIAVETQHQEEIAKLRAQFSKELNRVFVGVLGEFDSLPALDTIDLNVDAFLAEIHRIACCFKK